VVIGNQAFVSDGYAVLRDLAVALAGQVGTELIELSYGANSHGAWQAGAVPHRGPGQSAINKAGLDARGMFEQPLSAYLMLGVEPEYDCWNGAASIKALQQAESVVVLNAYASRVMRDYADVLLPIAPFTEHSGSMVNLLGMRQYYRANVKPKGSSRPAWKVLRVMADHLGVKGCGYADLDQLTAAFVAAQEQTPVAVTATTPNLAEPRKGPLRVGDAPIYAVDSITRRSEPLQQREDSLSAAVYLSQDTLDTVGAADQLVVTQGEFQATLPVIVDDRVAADCVYIPAGVPGTELLGPLVGPVTLAQV
jgi:NADH-quinone oxidoreductase subunit G